MGAGCVCEEGARQMGAGYAAVQTRGVAGTASRTWCACESDGDALCGRPDLMALATPNNIN